MLVTGMWRWMKRLVHHLAIALYGTLELWDIPKVHELPENENEGQ